MGFSEFIAQYKPFATKITKILLFTIGISILFQCKKKEQEITHQRGEMTIWVDPSNKNLITALTDIYTMKYPEVKFTLKYESESVILKKLMNLEADAAFINKPLDSIQTKYIEQESTIKPRSTLLAYDAVIFITSNQNERTFVDIEEIKNNLLAEKSQFVFDNANSGNFNTLIDNLKLNVPKDKGVQALQDTEKLFDFLNQSTNSIGIIGMNSISEKNNPKVQEILSKIKILPIRNSSNELIEPNLDNIINFKYPFFKGVYFIVKESGFGIGSGFSRFAGSQQGQLIVAREGLQPNYLYERIVEIRANPF